MDSELSAFPDIPHIQWGIGDAVSFSEDDDSLTAGGTKHSPCKPDVSFSDGGFIRLKVRDRNSGPSHDFKSCLFIHRPNDCLRFVNDMRCRV